MLLLVTGRYCEEHVRKVNSDYEKYSRDKSVGIDGDKGSREASFVGRGRAAE